MDLGAEIVHFMDDMISIMTLINKNKLWDLVRQQTIPTERPPLVSEVSANFSI
jgi:hypothetical protein